MLGKAAHLAAERGVGNARWVRARAEDLPAGLGCFRYATFAQSFQWMDRKRVADATFDMPPTRAGRHIRSRALL